jgi:hypothetical protein
MITIEDVRRRARVRFSLSFRRELCRSGQHKYLIQCGDKIGASSLYNDNVARISWGDDVSQATSYHYFKDLEAVD